MHVLQLGPVPPPEGGITRNILSIHGALLERGDKCSILATTRSHAPREGLEVYYPTSAIELVRLLLKISYDVLHLHIGGGISPRVLGLIALCGAISRGRSVLTLHSGGYASECNEGARSRSLTGLVFRSFGRLVCVNESMIHMLERSGVPKDRLRLIHPFSILPPDPATSIPETLNDFVKSHSPYLLTVGLLEGEYNLEAQIDYMERILRYLPNAGLLIVGSGSLETDLRERINSKHYKDSILLVGDVPHQVTMRLIEACDVLLRTTRFDGDAISIREALYFGKPVIATDNGMRPDGVALIANPMCGEELVKKVIEIVEGSDRGWSGYRRDGRENVNAVLRLYDEILKS